jgi:hypothetical protein
MERDEYQSWNELLATSLNRAETTAGQHISVERQSLASIANTLSELVYATERRYQDTADRLIYEHRERFRQDLIAMNDLRIRLNALLRDAS